MRRAFLIILLLSAACFGDTFTSHIKPNADSSLDIGTSSLLWRYIYCDAYTDGTALWSGNTLSGFSQISGSILTDGTLSISAGSISSAVNIDASGTITGNILTDGTATLSGGDITGMGDITGADVDISAGTGDYSSSGALGAGAITGTSFIIGANTLDTNEWAFLDGQDQAVKTTSSPTFVGLTLSGALATPTSVTSSGTIKGNLLHAFTTTDAASIQMLKLESDSATPADNDALYISFVGSSDIGTQTEFGRITCTMQDVGPAGTEDASLKFSVMSAGGFADFLTIDGAGLSVLSEYDWIIDSTGGEAFVVRKNADGGDIFTVDTQNGRVHLGADDVISHLYIHDAGTITLYDDSDDTSVVIGPVANGTTTLGITGSLSVSATVTAEHITSTDDLDITDRLTLADTTSADDGVIYKGATRFLHNFHHPTGGGAVPIGRNLFIGENAGNFAMGSTATEIYHASYNTGIGYAALNANTTGYYNTGIGYAALNANTTGHYNTGIGYTALYANTTGHRNTGIGSFALNANTTGYRNTGIGSFALYSNTTGYSNIGIGYTALNVNTTGYYNTGIGSFALYSNTTGYSNIGIGYQSGQYIATGGANQTATYSLYLGCDTRGSVAGATNEIVIGKNAIGKGSNTAAIGGNELTKLYIGGGGVDIDFQLIFDGETNDGVITWMEDEDCFDFADKIVASGGLRINRAVTNASDPPTDAELDTAFGTPATVGAGFVGLLDDNDAGTDVYICFTTGTDAEWFWVKGTKAL